MRTQLVRRIDCAQGSFVLIPGGAEHDFQNRGAVRAVALNISAPGGFEDHMGAIVDWFAHTPPGPAV